MQTRRYWLNVVGDDEFGITREQMNTMHMHTGAGALLIYAAIQVE